MLFGDDRRRRPAARRRMDRHLISIGDSSGVGRVYKVFGRPLEVGGTLSLHFSCKMLGRW